MVLSAENLQQEGPRALDCSTESWHIRWCIGCCSTELNILINFGRRHHELYFFEIILNLDLLFERRGHLKIFLICSSGSHFVQCFQTICAIIVVGLMQNISVKQY